LRADLQADRAEVVGFGVVEKGSVSMARCTGF